MTNGEMMEFPKTFDEWQSDTWTDNLSYECMIKIAKLFEPQESEDKE